jgi:hypothetical protein
MQMKLVSSLVFSYLSLTSCASYYSSLLTLLPFLGIYVCPTCTTATGRRTVSECHWSFLLTCLPRASAPHPTSCSLVENMSITFSLDYTAGILRINGALLFVCSMCSSSNRQRSVLSVVRLCYLHASVAQAPFHITVV